jgi:uncharacterized membrane protein (DUF441 family)
MADEIKPVEAPKPKLLDNPWVKQGLQILLTVALAWLASKGIKLPAEQAQPVNVYVSAPAH